MLLPEAGVDNPLQVRGVLVLDLSVLPPPPLLLDPDEHGGLRAALAARRLAEHVARAEPEDKENEKILRFTRNEHGTEREGRQRVQRRQVKLLFELSRLPVIE